MIRIILLRKSRCCERSDPFGTSGRITYQAKNKDESSRHINPKHWVYKPQADYKVASTWVWDLYYCYSTFQTIETLFLFYFILFLFLLKYMVSNLYLYTTNIYAFNSWVYFYLILFDLACTLCSCII